MLPFCKKDVQLLSDALRKLPAKQSLLVVEKDLIRIKKSLGKNKRGTTSCAQEIIPGNKTPKHLRSRLDKKQKPVLCIIDDRAVIKEDGDTGYYDITDVQAVISFNEETNSYYMLAIGDRLDGSANDVISCGEIPHDSPHGKKFTACVSLFQKSA